MEVLVNAAQNRQATNVAILSVISNTLLVILKLIVGIFIGSVSVISEAIHSGIDLVAAVIAFLAVREASKPADEDHPFGHGKFENVSGTVEAILIFVAAGWIIFEAIHKFKNPTAIQEPGWGIGLMLFSALVNLGVSEILFRVGKKTHSIALEADGWHLRTDVYTSLGVMGGLFLVWLGGKFFPSLNLYWIDPLCAIFIALLIVKAAYDLTLQAAKDLFDVSLPKNEIEWIRAFIKAQPETKGFHCLKTRKSGKDRFVEFHLVVDPQSTVAESHALTDHLTDAIKRQFSHAEVMIHVEPCDKSCRAACKSGCFADQKTETKN
jgi:cation diffusion facilitator family transporter